jgi:hypothetical protein
MKIYFFGGLQYNNITVKGCQFAILVLTECVVVDSLKAAVKDVGKLAKGFLFWLDDLRVIVRSHAVFMCFL